MNQWIDGTILPRTIHTFGTSNDSHVGSSWSSSTSFCIQEVIVIAYFLDFWSFQGLSFHCPIRRNLPTIIHFFHFTDRRKSIIRQAYAMSSAHKEPTNIFPFVINMARIYPISNFQIHRVAPRTIWRLGSNHIIIKIIIPLANRKIDIIFAIMLANIRCPYRT